MSIEGQLSLFGIIDLSLNSIIEEYGVRDEDKNSHSSIEENSNETEDLPHWKYYWDIDGKKVKAYLGRDKNWYVIKSLECDCYNMMKKRAFDISYRYAGEIS